MSSKQKTYLSLDELHNGGLELKWNLDGDFISAPLTRFLNKSYCLYKQQRIGKRDKELGGMDAIFSSNGVFYLEFTPRFLRSGVVYTEFRKHVRLKQIEKSFLLPRRHYLLLEDNP